MQNNKIVGDAIYAVTNPFETAGKFAKDPVGALSSTVGTGLTAVTDVIGSLFASAEQAKTTAKTNMLGYGLASALVLWIFYIGFREPLMLDKYLPF